MNKQEIAEELVKNHRSFLNYINSLSDDDFVYSKDEKWTAGQQLDHIIRAVKPLRQGFVLPAFAFGWLFGRSNRPGRTYQDLVDRYHQKLALGGKASGRFIPPPVGVKKKQKMIASLENLINILARQVKGFSERDLDRYILPHPLLGKLTLREMMYFTIYHVHHHEENVKKMLAEKN